VYVKMAIKHYDAGLKTILKKINSEILYRGLFLVVLLE